MIYLLQSIHAHVHKRHVYVRLLMIKMIFNDMIEKHHIVSLIKNKLLS